MNKNIIKTKQKLAIMFTMVVFLLILIFGLTYFSIKYINFKTIDKREFLSFTILIENRTKKITDVINEGNKISNRLQRLEKLEKLRNKKKKLEEHSFYTNGINYVYIGKTNKLISTNIREEIDNELVDFIYDKKDYQKLIDSHGYYIKKYNFNGGNFVLLKKQKYDIFNYLEDIFGFLISLSVLSLFLFLITRKFVDKTFVPVENNISEMNQFIQNAGHELKTPLSVMDSNIQIIKDIKTYDEEMIYELKTEIKGINTLIDGLVNLSNIGDYKEKEDVNLLSEIEEIIKNFQNKISNENIKTTINIPKNIILNTNKSYLNIFLTNIIQNAIKYNNIDGEINIKYKNNSLYIIDTGIGISPDDKKHIFDRFYQVDKSRNSKGFGIGLSLVKKISEINSWKIEVKDNHKSGTKFIIHNIKS